MRRDAGMSTWTTCFNSRDSLLWLMMLPVTTTANIKSAITGAKPILMIIGTSESRKPFIISPDSASLPDPCQRAASFGEIA